MKILATVLSLVLSLPAAARAEGPPSRPPKPFSFMIDSGTVSVHEPGFGHGLKYGVGFFFKTAKRAAFEVLLERFEVPIAAGAGRDEAGGGGLTAGRLETTSLVFSQHIYVLTRGVLQPFATLGVGFDFMDFAPDDRAALPRRDIVDRLALQLGGGADLRINGGLALSGRARYNMAKTWVQDLPGPDRIRDVDPLAQRRLLIYGLELSVGVKVTF